MLIANPVYDVVFKYLLTDNKVAKQLISLITGFDIVELTLCPTEFVSKKQDEKSFTSYRVDFSAKIKTQNGKTKNIIIEIQKAKFPTDIMRFRKYLSERYADENNTHYNDKNTRVGTPIFAIYIMGHLIDKRLPAVTHVKRGLYDAVSGEKYEIENDFIDALTHDACIVQIPKLQFSDHKSTLEAVLSIFREANSKTHIIEINEKQYPTKYQPIIRRLIKAGATSSIAQEMEIEDQFLYDLECFERKAVRAVAKAAKAIKAQKLAEVKAKKAKKDVERAKKDVERVKKDAERVKKDAERVKKDAERAKKDAERAKKLAEEKAKKDVERAKKLAEEKAKKDVEKAKKLVEVKLEKAIQTMIDSGIPEADARKMLS